jgi:hypothetical protein
VKDVVNGVRVPKAEPAAPPSSAKGTNNTITQTF